MRVAVVGVGLIAFGLYLVVAVVGLVLAYVLSRVRPLVYDQIGLGAEREHSTDPGRHVRIGV